MSKIEKIKAEIERLKNELIQEKEKGYGSDVDDACILELQNVLFYIDSLSDTEKDFGIKGNDLEEEIHRYYVDWDEHPQYVQTARHFAKWQKEQMIEEACKWLELHDSYAVPTNIKVRDLKEHLSSK